MRRLLASLTVASLLVAVGCSPSSPTAPVAKLNPKVSLDCNNGNNGGNPPHTAGGGGCGGNNGSQNAPNNPPTTSQN